MPEISDIELMQFADGMLDVAAQEMIEVELARSPELRERLEAFLITGKTLARLFEPVVKAPIPDRLTETILQSSVAHSTQALHKEVQPRLRDLFSLFPPDLLSAIWRPSTAVLVTALTCAVCVGVGVMWAVRSDTLVGPAAETMAQALETIPSGSKKEFALASRGAASLKPISTFRHRDSRYCRQYELALSVGRGFVGFACRDADGAWQIERDVVTIVNHDEKSETVRPAAPAGVQIIDDAIEKVAIGDSIEKESEQILIQGGWRAER